MEVVERVTREEEVVQLEEIEYHGYVKGGGTSYCQPTARLQLNRMRLYKV